jgi:hypothetical protein
MTNKPTGQKSKELVLRWSSYFDLSTERVDAEFIKKPLFPEKGTLTSVVSGVYVLMTKLEGGRYHAFYVGHSEDLHRRLSQHIDVENEQDSCIQELVSTNSCAVVCAQVLDEKDRLGVKKYLIEQLKWGGMAECNDRKSSVKSIIVNLPFQAE